MITLCLVQACFAVLQFETKMFTLTLLTPALQNRNLTSKLIKTSAVRNCCSENEAYHIFGLIIHHLCFCFVFLFFILFYKRDVLSTADFCSFGFEGVSI